MGTEMGTGMGTGMGTSDRNRNGNGYMNRNRNEDRNRNGNESGKVTGGQSVPYIFPVIKILSRHYLHRDCLLCYFNVDVNKRTRGHSVPCILSFDRT